MTATPVGGPPGWEDEAMSCTATAGAPTPIRARALRDARHGKVTAWAAHDSGAMAPGARVFGRCILPQDEVATLVGRG